MTEPNWDEIKSKLLAPWPKAKIKKAPKSGGKLYPYINARDVMDLYDEVVGPGNWGVEAEVVDPVAMCVKVTVRIHGVGKSDFGYPNNPVGTKGKEGKDISSKEPLKEAATDGFKRASVLWGPGRELYIDPSEGRDWSGDAPAESDSDAPVASSEADSAPKTAGKGPTPDEQHAIRDALQQSNESNRGNLEKAIRNNMKAIMEKEKVSSDLLVAWIKDQVGIEGNVLEQPMPTLVKVANLVKERAAKK